MPDQPLEPSPVPASWPEIAPYKTPQEAPQTSPAPQEDQTGRPHDLGATAPSDC